MSHKSIIRTVKNSENPFVMIQRAIFENPELSWKAKGLLGYLLSRPDNWSVRVADLVNRSTDGRDACYSALKELGDAGYITKHESESEGGRFAGFDYVVHESPVGKSARSEAEPVGKSAGSPVGKTVYGFSDTNNKECTNNNSNKSKGTPAKRSSKKPELVPLPEGFGISEGVRKWAAENKHTHLEQHLEAFIEKAQARGYTYADWDAAFKTAIRKNWDGIGLAQGQRTPYQQPAQPERQTETPKPATNLHVALAGLELRLFNDLVRAGHQITQGGIAAQAKAEGVSVFGLLERMKQGVSA